MFKILKSSTWLFLGGDVMDGFYFLFCIFMYFPHFLQWAFIFLKIREHISSKGELKTVYLWHINPGARGSTFNEVDFSIPYSDFLPVCARGMEIVLKKKKTKQDSSTLAWKIPWMEEPGRLQSMGSQRVGHHWATSLSLSLSWLQGFYSAPAALAPALRSRIQGTALTVSFITGTLTTNGTPGLRAAGSVTSDPQ